VQITTVGERGVRCQVSGLKGGDEVTTSNYMVVEDLEVYKKLCGLHIDVCDGIITDLLKWFSPINLFIF
jgi:hypothetical protein